MDIFKYFILAFLISCLIFSCGEKAAEVSQKENDSNDIVTETVIIDKLALQDFFETDNVRIDTIGRTIVVSVSGSQLLLSKKRKMGTRWGGSEPWASVAATYQAKTTGIDIDSLIYEVTMEAEKSRYSYSLEQLKKANHYLSICEAFARHLNNKDYEKVVKLLSPDITTKYNDVQLINFLQSTFREELIERTELIGTKIVESKYSFYINFWNIDNQAQTYSFSFLEGNDRIAGAQIIK